MHTALDLVLLETRLLENLRVRQEIDLRSSLLRPADLRKQSVLKLHHRHTALIAVVMNVAVSADLDVHIGGQCIHDRGTHSVQSAAGLVCGIVKLAARMQRRVHNSRCRHALRVHADRHASSVIFHCTGAVRLQCDIYGIAGTRQMFVHCVVHNLVNKMIQTLSGHASDVHSGSLPYGFESFQNGNTTLVISLFLCHVLLPFLDIPLDNITYWENPCKQQNVCFVKIFYFCANRRNTRKRIRLLSLSAYYHSLFGCILQLISYILFNSAALSFRSEEISFTESVDAAISSVLAARLVIRSSTSRIISVR